MEFTMPSSTSSPSISPATLNCTCGNSTIVCPPELCSPQVFTNFTVIFLQVLYIIILFVGIFGNVLTCTVISLRHNMRRSIHYYTFNLAVADLLILVLYVPTQMIYIEKQMNWTMGLAVCKVVNVILPVALVALIFTLLAITIDRARGLTRPFQWRSDSRKSAKIALPCIWILACLLSTPLFIYPRIEHDSIGAYCSDGLSLGAMKIYWTSMFVVWFLFPLAVIVMTHGYMIYVMIKDKSSVHQKHNKRMIRMIITLVTTYTVCTGLQHANFLYSTYFHPGGESHIFYAVSNFMVSLQAALNPVIYGTLRQDFKMAFKSIVVKLMKKFGIMTSETFTPGTAVQNTQSNIYSSFDNMFEEIRNSSPYFSNNNHLAVLGPNPDSPLLPRIRLKDAEVGDSASSTPRRERPTKLVSGVKIRNSNGFLYRPKIVVTESFDSGDSENVCDSSSSETFNMVTLSDSNDSPSIDAEKQEEVESTLAVHFTFDNACYSQSPARTLHPSGRFSRIFEKLSKSPETKL